MSALCLVAGGAIVRIATAAFTLGWIHSVERIPIEDAWVVEGDHLRLVESRVKGSGAGIEPGTGARLKDGWFSWTPQDAVRSEIVLRRSGVEGTGDWTLCTGGLCRPVGSHVPADADPVVLRSCAGLGEKATEPR